MHPRIPRLVMAAPMIAALAVTLAASGGAATARSETPALTSISSRLDGAVSTVLIESSEPVAYLTSQPDPLTVLVDLRNVNADALDTRPSVAPLAPVTGVAIERANAPDGSPVARVRVNLDRAAKHRVRSSRNLILVEVDRSGRRTGEPGRRAATEEHRRRAQGPDEPASEPGEPEERRPQRRRAPPRPSCDRSRSATGRMAMPSPWPATVRWSRPRWTKRKTCRPAFCWTSAT